MLCPHSKFFKEAISITWSHHHTVACLSFEAGPGLATRLVEAWCVRFCHTSYRIYLTLRCTIVGWLPVVLKPQVKIFRYIRIIKCSFLIEHWLNQSTHHIRYGLVARTARFHRASRGSIPRSGKHGSGWCDNFLGYSRNQAFWYRWLTCSPNN